MKKILSIAVIALFGMVPFVHAQTITKKLQDIKGLYPTFLEFSASDAPPFIKGNVLVQNKDQKIVQQAARLLRSQPDELGFTSYRYQQLLHNIPVEDAVYILHVKKGKVLLQNGRWAKDYPETMPRSAVVSEAAALQQALNNVKATTYRWQVKAEENNLKLETGKLNATYYPQGKLVYYSPGDELSAENLRLAYKFDVYAITPLMHKLVFVDAVTGAVLGTKELIQPIEGTAKTAYSGKRKIETTQSNGTHILNDITRGNGIVTMNMQRTTNYSLAVDFEDNDNDWNNVNVLKDEYATDAHWGAERTYDFFKDIFNRNSIDDEGFALKSYIHYDINYYNAFWDGEKMTYGDGDNSNGNRPLTSLDVCGHEITHGLTTFTAGLNYSNESGALNEGFSDIFGSCIEAFARPNKKDWLIGGDFGAIRDMSNPNAYSQPDTYKGDYWAKGWLAWLDNGGVHTNSGVLNYWFYLLTAGGSGTNDKGTSYNVKAIGISKAQAIAYRTLTTYLVPTSVYQDARTYSIQAAKDLYGPNSGVVKQVQKAWQAVGVKATSATALVEEDAPIAAVSRPAVAAGSNNVTVFRLYPNPVKTQFTLEFARKTAGKVYVDIYNMAGTKVYQQAIAAAKGANRVAVTLPLLSTGSYVVKLDNEKTTTIQVVQ